MTIGKWRFQDYMRGWVNNRLRNWLRLRNWMRVRNCAEYFANYNELSSKEAQMKTTKSSSSCTFLSCFVGNISLRGSLERDIWVDGSSKPPVNVFRKYSAPLETRKPEMGHIKTGTSGKPWVEYAQVVSPENFQTGLKR